MKSESEGQVLAGVTQICSEGINLYVKKKSVT